MENTLKKDLLSELRRVFWPIERHENKKFIPMALMMACILFNYSALRSVKDGLVVTNIGPEAISFMKLYVVLPSAILMMVLYAKLSNTMSQQKVFYGITISFVLYFAIFAFILYPRPEFFHCSKDKLDNLCLSYPSAQWFIRILGNWTFASFYVAAEMWGSMMLTLLFWQFANQITKTTEAKRFYSMFGLIGNMALLLISPIGTLCSEHVNGVSTVVLPRILLVVISSGIFVLFLYNWMDSNVLTDPTLYDPSSSSTSKKKKAKLTLSESLKMIFTSKYLGLIVVLVLAYGVSINLVEGIWKSKIKELYPTAGGYTNYMFKFQTMQGYASIFFMLVGSNLLRRVSWGTAATFTPVMILITGLAFFTCIAYQHTEFFNNAAETFLIGSPIALIVTIGMIQNVLSKATKYSLFDSTKEMSYIPLNDEMKTKGKAAVDVIGGRLGKSGGGLIQSTMFIIMPSFTFVEATPYFAGIFFTIVILWVIAVKGLSKEYHSKLKENEATTA